MNRQFVRFCGALVLLTICLSIVVHHRTTSFIPPTGFATAESKQTSAVWDWKSTLATHPQFAPVAPPPEVTQTVVRRGIENSTLIGVVPDAPAVAIIVVESNTVLRIELGQSWIEGWVLIEVDPDHIVWQNEITKEQYTQDLFIQDKKQTEALLSSAITN